MTAFNPLARRRSILQSRAVIRALDTLKADPNAKLGAGTVARLGTDPTKLYGALGNSGQGGQDALAAARQAALANWQTQGQGMEGGYTPPPQDGAAEAVAAARQPADARLAQQQGLQQVAGGNPAMRREQLLNRTGPNAISDNLRKRIMARIRNEQQRRMR